MYLEILKGGTRREKRREEKRREEKRREEKRREKYNNQFNYYFTDLSVIQIL